MKRDSAPRSTLLVAITAGAVGCAPPVELGSTLPDRLRTDVLASVVLIVKELPDAKIGYGSGLRVDDDRVLTNAHVVDDALRIAVLPWRPDRATYIDVDGGLPRLLYESQAELRTARLLRADVQMDLAVIEVPELPPLGDPLRWSERPVEQGQAVIAVGHPDGALWTVSSGHVSALHQAVIQHDAPLNKGNSGGPLLDRAGRVVGVNTRKPMGRTEGIGFARPIELAQALLDDKLGTASTLNRENPKVAFDGCMRASELGRPEADCVDWDSLREVILEGIVQRARGEGYSAQAIDELARATRRALSAEQVRDAFMERADLRARVMSIWGGLALSEQIQMDVHPEVIHHDEAEDSPAGAVSGVQDVQAALRNGLRVVDLWPYEETATWLRVEGRQSDGSTYELAQLMSADESGWHLVLTPGEGALAELPEDWPRPMVTRAEVVDLFSDAATLRLQEDAPVEQRPAEEEGGTP